LKTSLATITGLALLVLSGVDASAQRQANQYGGYGGVGGRNPRGRTIMTGDPRLTLTNGFDLISINNIFDANRYYRDPVVTQPVIPSYNFILTGVMTYGPNDVGYGFFSGNAVMKSDGAYGTSDNLNGYKITAITNNTVKVVDTNNVEYLLRVGSGFTKYGTNQWRFVSVPEAAPSAAPATSEDDTASSGLDASTDPVVQRLIARRRAALGIAVDAAAALTNPPSPDATAPAGAPADNSNTNSPASPN
jgi:hypothetical protein